MFGGDLFHDRQKIDVFTYQKTFEVLSKWLPTNKSYVCQYITNWIAIKVRWNLNVDQKEKDALILTLKQCKKTKIVVSKI